MKVSTNHVTREKPAKSWRQNLDVSSSMYCRAKLVHIQPAEESPYMSSHQRKFYTCHEHDPNNEHSLRNEDNPKSQDKIKNRDSFLKTTSKMNITLT